MHKKLEKTPSKQTLEQLQFYTDLRKEKGLIRNNGTSQSNKQFDIYPTKNR